MMKIKNCVDVVRPPSPVAGFMTTGLKIGFVLISAKMIGRSNQATQAGSIKKIVKRKQGARKASSIGPSLEL
jgi:hypothetical protein